MSSPVPYLVRRIEEGALDYVSVVARYSQFKSDIDDKLIADGYGELIT